MELVYKGVSLSMNDMMLISKKYKIFCTMELILENYPVVDTEDKAYHIAVAARDLMDRFSYNEEEAIEIAMERHYK